MNIYVIGPVTGIPGDNLAAFANAKELLVIDGGHRVVIPHNIINARTPWDEAMKISEGAIRALYQIFWHDFAIAMLDGWEESRGARIERDLAVALGIPCRPWREFL